MTKSITISYSDATLIINWEAQTSQYHLVIPFGLKNIITRVKSSAIDILKGDICMYKEDKREKKNDIFK